MEQLQAESAATLDLAMAWTAGLETSPCGCAFLARDDEFADALASGGAQGATGGPLLLTATAALSDATRAELQRLRVSRVTILGGRVAVSDAVADTLAADGLQVDRVSGATRIETAIAIAGAFLADATTDPLVVRAYGTATDPTAGFVDSLAAGREAARSGRAVLLTETDRLSTPLGAYLAEIGEDAVTVIGGEAAVAPAVLDQLSDLHVEAIRVAGAERAETAVAVARQLTGLFAASAAPGVVLVDGAQASSWAEGFAAASFAGAGPAVLSSGDDLPVATATWLGEGEAAGAVDLTCGPLVTPAACDAAATRLGLQTG